MKNIYLERTMKSLMVLVVMLFAFSCKEDPVEVAPPVVNITEELTGSAGGTVTFTGTMTDEVGISSVELVSVDLGLDKTISLSNELNYTLDYTHSIPETVEDGIYSAIVTVTNKGGKSVESNVNVTISTTIADNYERIWVAGGVLWWEWGTPEGYFYEMTKDSENTGWFEILLPSWSGYDEIKFLGQNAWEGDNWGLVDNADPNSAMLNSQESATIILPDLSKNPAYYKVRFNPNTMEYNYEEIIPDFEAPAEMFIIGKGFTDYPNLDWNVDEAIPMSGNPYEYGEYQFLVEGLSFSEAVDIKFIGQNTGWDGIDMGFEVGGELTAPLNWVGLVEGDGTADVKFIDQAGTYTVYLDYFLKRAVIWKE